jgi:hypothetical protein
VTELTLTFIFHASGILLALALARVPAPPVSAGAVRRITQALERATSAFLLRSSARLVIATVTLLFVVVGIGAAQGKLHASAVGGLALALGAGMGALSAWAGATLLTRASAGTLAAAERRFDLTLATVLGRGGAAGVLAQALGAAGALALFLADHRLRATGSPTPAVSATLAIEAAAALPAYALGAALAALVAEGSAASYRAAAEGGLGAAARQDRNLTAWDPRNPGLVSGLVSEKLVTGARAALLAATSAAMTSVCLVLATRLAAEPGEQARFAALPLVLTAFGLVACTAGVWVARALEAEGAAPALLRGQTSAAVIWLLGLAGACHWLFPEQRLWLMAAGATGLVVTALVTSLFSVAALRIGSAAGEVTDGLRAGPGPATAAALGASLVQAALALVLAGAGALGVRAIGLAAALPGGASLAFTTALAGALALAPFGFAVSALFSGAASARAVGAMSLADAEAARRLARLAESSQAPAAAGRSSLLFAALLPVLTSCLAPSGTETAGPTLPLAGPLLGWMTVLGGAVALAQAGAAAKRAARGARELALEVERQLAALPPGSREAGENGTTSYRACEELCSRIGLSAALPLAALGAAGPVVLGIGLFLVYRISGPWLAADALAMFVAGTAVTALGAALTVDGAHAVLAAARRASRPEADPATFAASVTGDALLSLLRNAVGPTVCSMALLAASFALLVSPLLP